MPSFVDEVRAKANGHWEAMDVLDLWLESIPCGDKFHSEANRVGAVMSLLPSGIKELLKAREAYSAK